MAESHKCQICGKPATVHLTQILESKIVKVDLCEACAHDKGVTDPTGFSLGEIFQTGPGLDTPKSGLVCEQCGFTPADFKKLGRFGCPACYEKFRPLLGPMLQNMHKDVVHRGKVPGRAAARVNFQLRLEELERNLQEAVKGERYEDAARCRDEIKQLKAALRPTES